LSKKCNLCFFENIIINKIEIVIELKISLFRKYSANITQYSAQKGHLHITKWLLEKYPHLAENMKATK
jgi:hypothetical protein